MKIESDNVYENGNRKVTITSESDDGEQIRAVVAENGKDIEFLKVKGDSYLIRHCESFKECAKALFENYFSKKD